MAGIALAQLVMHATWCRNEPEGERLVMQYADLGGADLRGADLRGVNLRNANLRGADLRGADLRGVNLRNADLRGADLRGADLRGVNLRGADLRGANLRGADLRGADLRGADLRDANLRGVNLRGVNLRGADLRGTDLRDANLRDANLRDANLRGTDLGGTDLGGTDLGGANLRGTGLAMSAPANGDVAGFATDLDRPGNVIGYRTRTALFNGARRYEDGNQYGVTMFSVTDTECHPGLHVFPSVSALRTWLRGEAKDYADAEIIAVSLTASWTHHACSKWRTRMFRVLGRAE